MDSLTQIVLGGCVAAAAVPAAHRRRAALAGAVLGTLPDLDSFPMRWAGVDAVTLVTWHRGPSHALPVLALFGLLLWWLLRRWWSPVREAPRRWLLAIWLALLTHPLLDAFTVYGTQLWWPLPQRPTMWSSVFIIDPGYTLALLVAFVAVLTVGARPMGRRFLAAGLMLSSAYLGWSLLAKALVEREARAALAAQGLADAPFFSTPTPFNTLLWRVVALTPDGMLEGFRSLPVDRGPLRFTHHPGDRAALDALADTPAVARLHWFTSGFLLANPEGDHLIVSDLRMGAAPFYSFRYRIAERAGPQAPWQAVVPTTLPAPAEARGIVVRGTWQRLWHEPAAQEPPFSFTRLTPARP